MRGKGESVRVSGQKEYLFFCAFSLQVVTNVVKRPMSEQRVHSKI